MADQQPSDLLSQLRGGQSAAPAAAPQPAPASASPSTDASGGSELLNQLRGNTPTIQHRPESSDEMDQARSEGFYSEPSERSGKPVVYLIQKPDESYTDFMKRAVEHGKTVTQEQMKDEAYQPKKIAEAAVVRPAEIAGTYAAAATGLTEGEAGYQAAKPLLKAGTKAIIEHVMQPGTILKFPWGRAVEYYLMGKMGLSSGHLKEIAKNMVE